MKGHKISCTLLLAYNKILYFVCISIFLCFCRGSSNNNSSREHSERRRRARNEIIKSKTIIIEFMHSRNQLIKRCNCIKTNLQRYISFPPRWPFCTATAAAATAANILNKRPFVIITIIINIVVVVVVAGQPLVPQQWQSSLLHFCWPKALCRGQVKSSRCCCCCFSLKCSWRAITAAAAAASLPPSTSPPCGCTCVCWSDDDDHHHQQQSSQSGVGVGRESQLRINQPNEGHS